MRLRPRRGSKRHATGALAIVLLFCLVLLLLLQPQETDATLTVEALVDPSQDVDDAKTWAIRSTSNDPRETLQTLSIDGSGNVFISFDRAVGNADDTRAIVRVTGASGGAVDSSIAIGTMGEDNQRQLRVQLSPSAQLVTEVILTQPNQVYTLSVLGSGDVVVGDQVLSTSSDASPGVQSGKIAIDVLGSGNVFVTSKEPLRASSASFSVSDSGDLQIEATEFQFALLTVKNSAGDAQIKIFTSSSVAVTSDISTSKASFSVVSSGDICWDVPNLHVDNLEVSVSGSGTISASQVGSCGTETVSVIGSGYAELGNVNCQRVQVVVSGSGDAVVQASEYLEGVITGSGDVWYAGQPPQVMSDKNGQIGMAWPGHSFKAIAKPAGFSNVPRCARKPVPTLEAHRKHDTYNVAPLAPLVPLSYAPGDVDPAKDIAPPITTTHSSDPSDQASWSSASIETRLAKLWDAIKANQLVFIPTSVFVAFWTVILCVSRRDTRRRRRQRRRRNAEQQPLLGFDRSKVQEKPVYV